jgi:hypothetical protein
METLVGHRQQPGQQGSQYAAMKTPATAMLDQSVSISNTFLESPTNPLRFIGWLYLDFAAVHIIKVFNYLTGQLFQS